MNTTISSEFYKNIYRAAIIRAPEGSLAEESCKSFPSHFTVLDPKGSIYYLNTDLENYQEVGSTIRISPVIGRGDGDKFKYEITKDSKVIESTDYSSDSEFVWTPNEAGKYEIKCTVYYNRSYISKSIEYTVVEKSEEETKSLLITDLVSSYKSVLTDEGTTTEFLIKTKGGQGNLKYSLAVNGEYILKNSSNNKVSWTQNKRGIYNVVATVEDESGDISTLNRTLTSISYDDEYSDDVYIYLKSKPERPCLMGYDSRYVNE